MNKLVVFGSVVLLAIAFVGSAFLASYSQAKPTYIALSTDIRGFYQQQPVIFGKTYVGLYAGGGRIGYVHHSEEINDPENAFAAAIAPRPPRMIWDHSDAPAATFQGSASLEELSYCKPRSFFGVTLYRETSDNWLGGSQINSGLMIDEWMPLLAAPSLFLLFKLLSLYRRRRQNEEFCPRRRFSAAPPT